MNILFMCVANSARSQMAEGLARKILGDRHNIYSAGSKPTFVNPVAIEAMKEIGIDITTQASKVVADLTEKQIDLVVTLCAEEVCPVFLGAAKKLHWPFPDPAGVEDLNEKLKAFRSVRNGIQQKIEALKAELNAKTAD